MNRYLPSEFVQQYSSTAVPAWVVENEHRAAVGNFDGGSTLPTWHVAQITPDPRSVVYLVDGPTYPVADGGSVIKDSIFRGLIRRGVKLHLVAAAWKQDHPSAYNKLAARLTWLSPDEYFSTAALRKVLLTINPRFLIVDSIETLRRCRSFWPVHRTLAILFDDYAATMLQRGHSALEAAQVADLVREMVQEGMVVARRGPDNLLGLPTPAPNNRIYRLEGIDLRKSNPKRKVALRHDTIIVGNFRYGPNRQGLEHLISASVNTRYSLAVIGDLPDILRSKAEQLGLCAPGIVSDVEQWIARAAIGIDPVSMGSGISTKILTYASQGTPVVCTQFAIRGIHPRVASMFKVVNHIDEVPGAVAEVGRFYKHWLEVSEAARCALTEYHDIEAELDLLMAELGEK